MHVRVASRLICSLILLAVWLPTVACEKARQMTLAGKYVSQRDANHTRELKSDGTVVEMQGSTGGEGKYEVSGDEITFRFQVLGTTRIMKSKLEGNAIVDGDGERFVKQ